MNVYVIEHISSGRVYVGKANSVERRWTGHLSNARRGKAGYFNNAIRKYGEKDFRIITILRFHSEEAAYAAEVQWIEMLQASVRGKGFNLDNGGRGGQKRSAQTIAKMSESAKRMSAETRARMSAAHKGKKLSPAQIALLRGRKRSQDAVDKTAASNRGKKRSPEQRARMSAAAKCRRAAPARSEATKSKISASMKALRARARESV